jgi:hypothetical protein
MSWVAGSSVWWGGGELAVGVAGQPPAALMHRPVVSPAHQGQVGKVGGAAVQPMSEVVALAPARGSLAAGEHTATVAHDQGGALGGLHDRLVRPTSNGTVGAPPRVGGSRVLACWSWAASPSPRRSG